MEKIIGELYRSGDKTFTTEKECLQFERTKAIEDFLMTQGYERYDGGMKSALGIGYIHIFKIHSNRIMYSKHFEFSHSNAEYYLCDLEVFKMFFFNMFTNPLV